MATETARRTGRQSARRVPVANKLQKVGTTREKTPWFPSLLLILRSGSARGSVAPIHLCSEVLFQECVGSHACIAPDISAKSVPGSGIDLHLVGNAFFLEHLL